MKKKLFVFTSLLLLLFSAVMPLAVAEAQAPAPAANANQWWNQDLNTFRDKVFPAGSAATDTEIFGERYTFAQVNWIVNSLALLQAGSMAQCFAPGKDTSTCVSEIQQQGAMSSPILFLAGAADSFLSYRPASGLNYIAYKVKQYSPVHSAYAQAGTGFGTLQPLQVLWTAFRNVAFGLMSFVIIVLAFMIMLRQKIAPQVVISAQSALPKVAIALIFITFSYAIAGLIIDLAYVVMGLAAAIFAQSSLFATPPNVIDLFNKLNNPIAAFTSWTLILGGFLFAIGASSVVGIIATGGLGSIAAGVAGIIGVLLLALGLIAIFRIFVTMLKAFTTVVFLVIWAPLVGLLGVVSVGPGIGGWVRQMVAQLSVFVTICLTMLVAHMVFWTMTVNVEGWLGEIVTGGANFYDFKTGGVDGAAIILPGFGGFPIQILAFFIGFGVIFSAPKLAAGVRDQIATGRGSFGFDSGGTMIGSGIPFIGGFAMGQMKRGQNAVGNVVGSVIGNRLSGSPAGQKFNASVEQLRKQQASASSQTTGALKQMDSHSKDSADRLG